MKKTTRTLTEGAAMVALASVLSCLKFFELPQGGSICIGMLPIILFSVRYGVGSGLIASLAFGIEQLFFDGAYAWGWTSMILDYVIAFALLGFSGIFRGKKGGVFYGTLLGCALRFIVHFISGITIYRIYAPTEVFNHTFTNPYLYSLIYNGSYVFIDMIFCLIVFAVLQKPMRKYFVAEDLRT